MPTSPMIARSDEYPSLRSGSRGGVRFSEVHMAGSAGGGARAVEGLTSRRRGLAGPLETVAKSSIL